MGTAATSIRARAARCAAVLRTIIGVPDYDRYLAHVRERHPGTEPLTREAFEVDRLRARYQRPGSRCC